MDPGARKLIVRICRLTPKNIEEWAKVDIEGNQEVCKDLKPNMCPLCTKCFTYPFNLKLHFQRRHKEEKCYVCSICDQLFLLSSKFETHVRIHAGSQPLKCHLFPKWFSDEKIQAHKKNYSEVQSFRCSFCAKRFNSSSERAKHWRCVHRAIQKFKCSFCEKTLTSKTSLKCHERSHGDEKPYKCYFCEKCFTSIGYKNEHMRIIHLKEIDHLKIKSNHCAMCNQSFVSFSELKRHFKIHTGEKSHFCSMCDRSFFSSSDLYRHIVVHTGEKPFECAVCSKRFAYVTHLKRHVGTHSNERPFKCYLCQKGFKSHTNMTEHIKCFHRTARPFKCSFCKKGFKARWKMRRHETIHMDDRKFQCPRCEKTFTNIESRKSHIKRIHTKEKKQACSFCALTFFSFTELADHIRVHTGEKPYKCSKCYKHFRSHTNLYFHRKSDHCADRLYNCIFCKMKYTSFNGLNRHLKCHTGE